jgi:hypothetical protein
VGSLRSGPLRRQQHATHTCVTRPCRQPCAAARRPARPSKRAAGARRTHIAACTHIACSWRSLPASNA